MVAKPDIDPRGLKRICTSCGNRFYDLNKRPITCPSCNTEFTGEIKIKARRSRVSIADDMEDDQVSKKTANDDDEDDIMIGRDDTLSLEDLDEDGGDESEDDEMGLDMDDDLGDLDDLEPDADDLDDLDEDAGIGDDEADH